MSINAVRAVRVAFGAVVIVGAVAYGHRWQTWPDLTDILLHCAFVGGILAFGPTMVVSLGRTMLQEEFARRNAQMDAQFDERVGEAIRAAITDAREEGIREGVLRERLAPPPVPGGGSRLRSVAGED